MNIVFEKENVKIELEDFLEFLNKKSTEYFKENCPSLSPHIYTAEPGKKYIRIVVNQYGNFSNRSVYCFLDMEGNIYKSASWKIPAKHIRGSIFDERYSWGKGLGPYGASYLR